MNHGNSHPQRRDGGSDIHYVSYFGASFLFPVVEVHPRLRLGASLGNHTIGDRSAADHETKITQH
ncbi:hypothetical protein BDZ94DRAFT_1277884 [Collybia nuda]|uniref:Uncharacterized protein n=1 Tax=Collybia nuda TaxID=64659 RepID=A0A9P5XU93_9AGAR|nr:hypothetical protein BDZ94DRAFT_1277884 [Collybia nuda]